MGCSGWQVDGLPESLELSRYWELEHNPEQTTDVQGRHKEQASFSRDTLQAHEPIIGSITNVYKLSLLSGPPQYLKSNQQSALDNAKFVENFIGRSPVKPLCG